MQIDDGFAQLPTIAAASVASPAAGFVKLFFNSANSNRLSQKDSAGAVIDLAATITEPFVTTLTNNTVALVETVVAKWAIPANSLVPGQNLDLSLSGQVSSTATLAFKIRLGATGTITDALLATLSTSGAGTVNAYHTLEAMLTILSTTTATAWANSQLANASVGVVTAAFAAATVNLTLANVLSITLVQSVAQTYTSRAAKLSL